MKTTLVGTGAIHSPNNSASVLIDDKILIDVPNVSEKNLMRLGKKIQDIELILITHLHADHYFDLPFIFAYNKVVESQKKLYIVGPKRTKEIVMSVTHLAFSIYFDEYIEEHVEFIEVEGNSNIEILEGYNIKSEKVEHGNAETYGYIINDRLGITGDSKRCEGIENIIKKSQKIIIDVSMIKSISVHMGIDDINILVEKYPEKQFIATHMRDITRQELKKSNIQRLIIPEDGYEFEL